MTAFENNKFEPLKKQFLDLNVEMTKLRGDLTNLENGLSVAKLRAAAQKLGISDPNIRRVSLASKEKFSAVIPFPNKTDVFLQFMIVGIHGNVLTIRMDGRDRKGNTFDAVELKFDAVPGNVYSLQQFLPSLPPLLFVILDRPTPQTLDVAIGPPIPRG